MATHVHRGPANRAALPKSKGGHLLRQGRGEGTLTLPPSPGMSLTLHLLCERLADAWKFGHELKKRRPFGCAATVDDAGTREPAFEAHAFSCSAMPTPAVPCLLLQCHAYSCSAMPTPAVPCLLLQCHAYSCSAMPTPAVPCLLLQCHAYSCSAMPTPAVPCLLLQGHAYSCSAMPTPAAPY